MTAGSADAGGTRHEAATAFARCLRTPAGAEVLAHLRRVALDRRLPPTASDRELWHLEGQRHLASLIHALAERGAEAPPASSSEIDR